MKIILPEKQRSPEVCIVAKNDDHYESMTGDSDFMQLVEKRNIQANGLMNLNNAELTKAGDNAAQNAEVLVKPSKGYVNWINRTWRPLMACQYMLVCIADFFLFPIAWSALQVYASGSVTTPWQPITLQGAAVYHLAMGAILGIAAYGRTKEKIEGVASYSDKDDD